MAPPSDGSGLLSSLAIAKGYGWDDLANLARNGILRARRP